MTNRLHLVAAVVVLLTAPAYSQSAACAGSADGSACDDGNPCTAADTCHAGGCAGMLVDDGVRVSRPAPGDSTAVISWSLAPGATGSDVLRGQVNALPVSPTDLWETVLVKNTAATTFEDPALPGPGVVFWYLVRGRTLCGPGPWGFAARNGVAATQREPREGCVVNVNASPRYVDQGWTVTDFKTCLQWEKKNQAGESTLHDVTVVDDYMGSFRWIDAMNAEAFAGYSDWRLPTAGGYASAPTYSNAEIESLVDYAHSPRIDPIFGPTADTFYWSSSRYAGVTNFYWGVDFHDGFPHIQYYPDLFPMRAVRGEAVNAPPE